MLKRSQLLPDFSFNKFVKRMLDPCVQQLCGLVKSAEKVKTLSNRSQIKIEFDHTFARLPFDFPLFSKKLGHVKTL